jgi:cyclopropane fatty-acyl-phospholipid synthase-like methyltransferase
MGVEISPEQVEYCKQNVTDQVFLTDNLVQFIGQRHGYWNCIAMLDVIEHLPRQDVIPILAAIHSALSDGGVILIQTGNMASLTGPYLRYIDFTHESGFTENSMRQILRAVGFSEIKVSGNKVLVFSWRSRIFALARKLWEFTLRLIYRLERGWDSTPEVFSKLLIAWAKKSTS